MLSSPNIGQAYGTLISHYQAYEADIDRNSVLFKANHPTLAALYEHRDNLRRTMLNEAQVIVTGMTIRIRELEMHLAYGASLNELEVQSDASPNHCFLFHVHSGR